MKVCALLIGDGRTEIHERSHASLTENLPRFDAAVVIDDSDHSLGFAGVIAEGWRQVLETGAEWVFHAELDFTYRQPVPLEAMVGVLREQKHLAQMALLRQPWNDAEKAAGGVIQVRPDEYEQRVVGGTIWTEHRVCFTTNPSVYSTNLCRHGWPQVEHSEGVFTHRLLEDPNVRFAFWGGKNDEPLVDHIGVERVGVGY